MQRLVKQIGYQWKVLCHPIDGFYDIVYKDKGSVLSASIIYFLLFVVEALRGSITGFIFNPDGIRSVSILNILISRIIPLLVWVLANYLISSITNGQGTLRAIYIATAYSLAPYMFLTVPLAIISNAMTKAESSIYTIMNILMVGWLILMFYLQVKEVHGYDVFEAIINILWILFAIAAMIAFALALSGITMQSANFVYQFVRETIGYV
jgi:hypothetical protein